MKRRNKVVAILSVACMLLPLTAIAQTAMAETDSVIPASPTSVVKNTKTQALPTIGARTDSKDLTSTDHSSADKALLDTQSRPANGTPAPSPAPAPAPAPSGPKAKSPLKFRSFAEDPIDFNMPKAANRFKDVSGNTWTIGRPTMGDSGSGMIPQGLESFYKQKLQWGNCTDFRSDYGKADEAQCAYAIAPLDYTKPNGPTIAVGLLKMPARDHAHKLGTLFLDPGGPGRSGMELAFYMGIYNAYRSNTAGKSNPIFDRFDVIGFDPRGVGSSLPQLRCESSAAFTAQREGSDDLSGKDLDKIQQHNARECYKNTARGFKGLSGNAVIPQVGTSNVARDLDMLRSVVGDTKLNYLGFSYGSSIGYTYAKLFPHNIRALAIDGIVNPLENNPELLNSSEFAKYLKLQSGDSGFVQGQSFNATFRQFLSSCLAEKIVPGEKCPFANPKNPVEGQPTDAQINAALKLYQNLVRKAWGTGYYHSSDDPNRAVSFNDLIQGVIESMYSQDEWVSLQNAFNQLKVSQDASGLLKLSDQYYNYDSTSKKYNDFSDAAFNTISCVDREYDPSFDEVDYNEPNEEQIEYYKAVPFQDPGLNKDGTQRGVQPTHDWCHFYKTHGQRVKGEPIEGLPNTLVVSSTYDPATPFENGPIAAKLLKGTLLVVANKQHCAYGHDGLDCATNLVNEYLVNPDNFTAKVKDGYYKITKDPNLTGDTNISTKDVYSNIIQGNRCQIISFMADTTTSPSSQPEKPKNPIAMPKHKPVITNGKSGMQADAVVPMTKHAVKSSVILRTAAKTGEMNLANTGSAVTVVIVIMTVALFGSVMLIQMKKIRQ